MRTNDLFKRFPRVQILKDESTLEDNGISESGFLVVMANKVRWRNSRKRLLHERKRSVNVRLTLSCLFVQTSIAQNQGKSSTEGGADSDRYPNGTSTESQRLYFDVAILTALLIRHIRLRKRRRHRQQQQHLARSKLLQKSPRPPRSLLHRRPRPFQPKHTRRKTTRQLHLT